MATPRTLEIPLPLGLDAANLDAGRRERFMTLHARANRCAAAVPMGDLATYMTDGEALRKQAECIDALLAELSCDDARDIADITVATIDADAGRPMVRDIVGSFCALGHHILTDPKLLDDLTFYIVVLVKAVQLASCDNLLGAGCEETGKRVTKLAELLRDVLSQDLMPLPKSCPPCEPRVRTTDFYVTPNSTRRSEELASTTRVQRVMWLAQGARGMMLPTSRWGMPIPVPLVGGREMGDNVKFSMLRDALQDLDCADARELVQMAFKQYDLTCGSVSEVLDAVEKQVATYLPAVRLLLRSAKRGLDLAECPALRQLCPSVPTLMRVWRRVVHALTQGLQCPQCEVPNLNTAPAVPAKAATSMTSAPVVVLLVLLVLALGGVGFLSLYRFGPGSRRP